ncbi:flagellar biosynthetic protein FliR [Caenimonas sp. SL110]|uniref:flagellar biosynthetic protein FliR n=1 Tax=Caenimonas sp. SL110 TaxID=1450524 RepID=UPI000A821533|nr:flagellar biosynthetic protein FliR [Caenimonas sp. SL110]
MNFSLITSGLAGALDPGYVVAVFLLSLRLSAVFLMTPVLYAFGVPAVARVLLVIGMAAALALGVPTEGLAVLFSASSTASLFVAAMTEVALGAMLALGILSAFAAISLAGRLIDIQIGFGMAQVYDPVSNRQVPVLTSAFDRLGVIAFFLINGHHALLRGIAFSLERFPLGRPWPLEATVPLVIKQVGGLFAMGFALAAPVVVCLLLVELALGVVARNLPQMNMFVIGIPLKIVVGLAALSLWFGGMGDSMSRIYGSIYKSWDATLSVPPVPAQGAR